MWECASMGTLSRTRRLVGGPTSYWLLLLLACLTTLSQVTGSGVFELRLKSFVNDLGKDAEGHCCSGFRTSSGKCSGVCLTKFRVCLKHYQTTIDPTPPCTFGDVVSPVLGNNSVHMDDVDLEGFKNPIEFKFDFSWPGTFSLIVEAWHATNMTGSAYGGEDTLISRLATQRWLDVSDNWTQDEHMTSDSVMRYEYRVRCDPHYYGEGCAALCRPRDDTFGHYTCSEAGQMMCLPGWTGEYCTRAVCLKGCHEQHGSCTEPNECKCQLGWKGPFCDQCMSYPGCLHGSCQLPWQCNCDEGWGGLFCNQDLNYCTNHKPCRNGGTCFNTGQGSYTCNCPEGYSGTDCEIKLDDCAHQPCLNGGTCRDNGTSYVCACPTGWHGRHCETSAQTCADTPCKNKGTCIDTEEGYLCHCPPGYAGTTCEVQIDECSPSPCLNGGSCVDQLNGFRCHCPTGFTGDRCETNIDDCRDNPCLNGGSCQDQVNGFKCQCVPGMVGSLCQDKVNYCLAKPCANGGECREMLNDFRCACRPGFGGKDCSSETDECASAPCLNGGTCVDRVNEFVCQCKDGFGGARCEGDATTQTNVSRRVSDLEAGMVGSVVEGDDDDGLSAQHVVLIATVSTAIPLLVLVAAAAVVYMKYKRKRERRRADDEARKQNEQNSMQGMSKKCLDEHMIVNPLDYPKAKCVNTSSNGLVPTHDEPDCCNYSKDNSSYHTLQRTKSSKQLNIDSVARRASALSDKLDKDYDNLCANSRTPSSVDRRVSTLTLDSHVSSLCNNSEGTLVKRPADELSCGQQSSVYVIGEHYPEGLFATEV